MGDLIIPPKPVVTPDVIPIIIPLERFTGTVTVAAGATSLREYLGIAIPSPPSGYEITAIFLEASYAWQGHGNEVFLEWYNPATLAWELIGQHPMIDDGWGYAEPVRTEISDKVSGGETHDFRLRFYNHDGASHYYKLNYACIKIYLKKT